MTENESWTIEHFSLSNPAGNGQESVPALLHRLADTIEDMNVAGIQDIVFRADIDDEGRGYPSMTVYFSRA